MTFVNKVEPMIASDKTFLTVNEKGQNFYKKWRDDTWLGITVITPISLTLVVGCFTMIIGISVKLLLVLVLPIVILLLAFMFVPLWGRKKYLNCLINKFEIRNDQVTIKTFDWFFWKSVSLTAKINAVEIIESTSEGLFAGNKVRIVRVNDIKKSSFYLVDDFFDNPISISNH